MDTEDMFDKIDLFQEAFNFVVTYYNRTVQSKYGIVYTTYLNTKGNMNPRSENFTFATFSIKNYFNLFPHEFKDVNDKYMTIEHLLIKKAYEQSNQSFFYQLTLSSKYKIIELLCKNIHLHQLPQQIESYLLGETCYSCLFKEHTIKWLYCDSCPTDIDVIQVDKSKYEKIFKAHLNGDIFYEIIDSYDEDLK